MNWTIRDSEFRRVERPGRAVIETLVSDVRESEPPIVILEAENGDYLEAVAFPEGNYLVGFRLGSEAGCSALASLSSSTVVEMFDLRARDRPAWKELVQWRPLYQLEDGLEEAGPILEWACGLELQVREVGAELSEEGQAWVTRRLIRNVIAERASEFVPSSDEALKDTVSYELERLVLQLLGDSKRAADG